jgi:hypothetical protein
VHLLRARAGRRSAAAVVDSNEPGDSESGADQGAKYSEEFRIAQYRAGADTNHGADDQTDQDEQSLMKHGKASIRSND